MRLDKRDDSTALTQPFQAGGNRQPLRRPCEIDHNQVDALLWGGSVQRVGAFHHDNALVVAEFPRQGTVAGVDGKDLRRAALQQAIGESADVAAESRRKSSR